MAIVKTMHNEPGRVARDPRIITTGKKNEKGQAVKLKHFNIERFPELIALYGPEPTELYVMCPEDDLERFYADQFAKWKGFNDGIMIRECDGETCIHHLPEKVMGKQYGAGEVSECVCETMGDAERKENACTYTMRLTVYVLNPKTMMPVSLLPIQFKTGGASSGKNVFRELRDVSEIMGGRMKYFPFTLSVRWSKSKNDPKVRYPSWGLTRMGSIENAFHRLMMIERYGANLLTYCQKLSEAKLLEAPSPGAVHMNSHEFTPEARQIPPMAGEPAPAKMFTSPIQALMLELGKCKSDDDLVMWLERAKESIEKLSEKEKAGLEVAYKSRRTIIEEH
jgi:hypothetical protein